MPETYTSICTIEFCMFGCHKSETATTCKYVWRDKDCQRKYIEESRIKEEERKRLEQ